MVNPDDIAVAINPRKNKILLYAQMVLSSVQFEIFRKLVLDELGNSGFVKDVHELFRSKKER